MVGIDLLLPKTSYQQTTFCILNAIIQNTECQQPIEDPARYITLLNCMLVNSSWEDEAIRVFWKETYRGPGYRPLPTLERLLNASPERRQRYANHICRLEISHNGMREPLAEQQYAKYSDDEDSGYEAYPLMKIGRLSFPRLESLII